ncbi:helix-turn-helix domain-containing protein [Fibrella aquatilis]|uniref:Helix-turn-helix transcriptional regulator n=1 Tax=Fibrella aquatilis TaxID=2817059 RepID=A0A939K179_9BACT|nr:AraC family transcriptional regulator [Fibrella aquatilis]MBO0933233.1 helix-turn-helix transcriptional regulator [Fibrella aquatilis]
MNQQRVTTGRTDLILDPDPAHPVRRQHLFEADFYLFKQWTLDPNGAGLPYMGISPCFALVFSNAGQIKFDLADKAYELHTGYVVVEKGHNYDFRLYPSAGVFSILDFTDDFYEQLQDEYGLRHSFFFGNPNLLTLGLKTSPAIDYLHYQLGQHGAEMDRLERDQLVLDLVRQVVERMNQSLTEPLSTAYKRFHLTTIEQAKAYLNQEFHRDLSLLDLASHCCVSPFHLGRLFKACTGYAPHQYLLTVRLTHAERLLRDTGLPITDVSFAAGFNSIEHFATAFRQRYHASPSQYRKQGRYQ